MRAARHVERVARGVAKFADGAPLAERFAHPPAQARILKIIHGWPDDPAQQDQWRANLLRQGFGGVVCNVSFQQYLESAKRWEAFERAVTEARKDGMALWLYDEKGYPSGNAGGLVLRDHPDWEAEGLLIADTECAPGPVTLEVPPGKAVLAAAFPSPARPRLAPRHSSLVQRTMPPGRREGVAGRIDLPLPTSDRLTDRAAGALAGGRDHPRPAHAGTHAEMNLAEKTPYINLLRRSQHAAFWM
jgi:hypothetical protein